MKKNKPNIPYQKIYTRPEPDSDPPTQRPISDDMDIKDKIIKILEHYFRISKVKSVGDMVVDEIIALFEDEEGGFLTGDELYSELDKIR